MKWRVEWFKIDESNATIIFYPSTNQVNKLGEAVIVTNSTYIVIGF